MSKARTYTYFPGCMIPYRLQHFELTMTEVLKKLNVQLEISSDHSCCPEPTTFTGVDFEAWVTIASRNVAVSEALGNEHLAVLSLVYEGARALLAQGRVDEAKARADTVHRVRTEKLGPSHPATRNVKALIAGM